MKLKQKDLKQKETSQTNSLNLIQDENRRAILLLSLLAILSSVLFLQFGSPFGVDGHVGIVNMDTFLYSQYARAWADGHPYQFNAIDPPTTGCTSHVYPAVLGFFYWAGFQELSLLDVAFALNVLFFIISVVCFWFIVRIICPNQRWVLSLLFVFSGHIAMILFGLSDAGIFLCASLLTWYAALYRRPVFLGICLFLIPFVRPEGMVIVSVYGFILLIQLLFKYESENKNEKRIEWIVFGAGLIGMILVGILNKSLTGQLAYDSTFGKGHFVSGHLLTGLSLWGRDVLYMFRGIFLGSDANIRLYYMIPVLSSFFIFFGLLQLPWGKKLFSFPWRVEIWWLVSFVCTIFVITMSGYQMMHFDRYLIWLLPLLLPYLIRGVSALPLQENSKKGLYTLFILFQLGCYPVFLQNHVVYCGKMKPVIEEIKKAKEFVLENEKIAVQGGSGIKYFHPNWHVINVGGVTSPYFRDCKGTAMKIKKIQYSPDLQFQKYFTRDPVPQEIKQILASDSIVVEVPHPFRSPVYLFQMDWQKLCSSKEPMNTVLLKQLNGLKLSDKLDIAYPTDETRCQYESFSRYAYGISKPFLSNCPTHDDTTTVDAARGVLGWDRFTFQTVPQKTHWLVVRSLIKADVLFQTLEGMKSLTINTRTVPQLILQIEKTNRLTIDWENLVSPNDGNVMEWIVKIPGQLITDHETTFSLLGDHIVCDYWLYVSE